MVDKFNIRDRVKEIRKIRAGDLAANPLNWRVHPRSQQDAMTGVLKELGAADVLKAYEQDGVLVLLDGHLRTEIDPDFVWNVAIMDFNDSEADEYLATHDVITGMADSDAEILKELLGRVVTKEPALAQMMAKLARSAGITEAEPVDDPGANIAEADKLLQKWGCKYGDLYGFNKGCACPKCGRWCSDPAPKEKCVCGNIFTPERLDYYHKVLCGDSTHDVVYRTILGDDKPTLLFCDPPYGVAIGSKNTMTKSVLGSDSASIEENLIGDDLSFEDLSIMLTAAFTTVKPFLADDCSVFVFCALGGELGLIWLNMMTASGLPVRHILDWVKNSPLFSAGRLDYDYQHETMLFTWNKTHKRRDAGQFHTSTWMCKRPNKSPLHPTTKPVELPENAILNHTDKGDLVLDNFAGSGTTTVAAAGCERRSALIELDLKYVAVILERVSGALGIQPELIGQYPEI